MRLTAVDKSTSTRPQHVGIELLQLLAHTSADVRLLDRLATYLRSGEVGERVGAMLDAVKAPAASRDAA